MSDKRVSDMTEAEILQLAGARPVTPDPGARAAGPVRVQLPGSAVVVTYASRAERDASLRLAEARQEIAEHAGGIPAWSLLSDYDREMAATEARNWLRAAVAAGLADPGLADPRGDW